MAIVFQGQEIFEKNVQQLPFTYDRYILEEYVSEVITKYPENDQIKSWGRGYGGWIIQGRKDDPVLRQWDNNATSNVNNNNFEEWIQEIIVQCHHKSDIAKHFLIQNIIEHLEFLGFNPRRMRLSKLIAGRMLKPHNDLGLGIKKYAVRFHIPCITNEDNHWIIFNERLNTKDFKSPEKDELKTWIKQNEDKIVCRFHLEAGKAYLIKTNNLHTVTNCSTEDRYHINCNIWDTKNLSKFPFNNEYKVKFEKT